MGIKYDLEIAKILTNIEDEKLEKAIEKNIKKEENKLIQYLVRQGFSLNKVLSKYKEFKENNDLEGE